MKKLFTSILCTIIAFAMVAVPVCIGSVSADATAMDTEATVTNDVLLTVDLLSDTHIGQDGAADTFKKTLKRIQSENNSDGVIISGDLCTDGKEGKIKIFYNTLYSELKTIPAVTATGNHDFHGLGEYDKAPEGRQRHINYRNKYLGTNTNKIYYSAEIKGYKFIVLGDEGSGMGGCSMSEAQFKFLENEMKSNPEGRPVFVICHWPMRTTNGELLLWPIWPGGALSTTYTTKIQKILSQYDNVFYISGHLHAGLNGTFTKTVFGSSCVEKHSGVNCINVPALGETNRFGVRTTGTGMELKIYKDKVVINGRNYVTGQYYSKYTYKISLDSFDTAFISSNNATESTRNSLLKNFGTAIETDITEYEDYIFEDYETTEAITDEPTDNSEKLYQVDTMVEEELITEETELSYNEASDGLVNAEDNTDFLWQEAA